MEFNLNRNSNRNSNKSQNLQDSNNKISPIQTPNGNINDLIKPMRNSMEISSKYQLFEIETDEAEVDKHITFILSKIEEIEKVDPKKFLMEKYSDLEIELIKYIKNPIININLNQKKFLKIFLYENLHTKFLEKNPDERRKIETKISNISLEWLKKIDEIKDFKNHFNIKFSYSNLHVEKNNNKEITEILKAMENSFFSEMKYTICSKLNICSVPSFLIKNYKKNLKQKIRKFWKLNYEIPIINLLLESKFGFKFLKEKFRDLIDERLNIFDSRYFSKELREMLFKFFVVVNLDSMKNDKYNLQSFLNNFKKYVYLMGLPENYDDLINLVVDLTSFHVQDYQEKQKVVIEEICDNFLKIYFPGVNNINKNIKEENVSVFQIVDELSNKNEEKSANFFNQKKILKENQFKNDLMGLFAENKEPENSEKNRTDLLYFSNSDNIPISWDLPNFSENIKNIPIILENTQLYPDISDETRLLTVFSFSIMLNNLMTTCLVEDNQPVEDADLSNIKVLFTPNLKCSSRERNFLLNLLFALEYYGNLSFKINNINDNNKFCYKNDFNLQNKIISSKKENTDIKFSYLEINSMMENSILSELVKSYSKVLFDDKNKQKLILDYEKVLEIFYNFNENDSIIKDYENFLKLEIESVSNNNPVKKITSKIKNLYSNISLKFRKASNVSVEKKIKLDLNFIKFTPLDPISISPHLCLCISGGFIQDIYKENFWLNFGLDDKIMDYYFFNWQEDYYKSGLLNTFLDVLNLKSQEGKITEYKTAFRKNKKMSKGFGRVLAYIIASR